MNNNFLGYFYKDIMYIFEMFYMILRLFYMYRYFYNFIYMYDDDYIIVIKVDNYIYRIWLVFM